MSINVAVQLDLVIHAVIRSVILEAVKWIFASVKAALAALGFLFFVLLALLILKASTRHIFGKSFIRFHKASYLITM